MFKDGSKIADVSDVENPNDFMNEINELFISEFAKYDERTW
ncbi:MAG: hypothetical protein Q9M91_07815 [Candidatus Dojkabacteria bacterium]|nr:hypothetical protein [Candidatus Dojkabacteria bacterium]